MLNHLRHVLTFGERFLATRSLRQQLATLRDEVTAERDALVRVQVRCLGHQRCNEMVVEIAVVVIGLLITFDAAHPAVGHVHGDGADRLRTMLRPELWARWQPVKVVLCGRLLAHL